MISKWACPDMIAYIFLLYLVRHLNRPPINGLFTLDIGFACYTLFCWGSTISSQLGHLESLHWLSSCASCSMKLRVSFSSLNGFACLLIFEAQVGYSPTQAAR